MIFLTIQTILIISILVFFIVIILLVILLLFAKAKLTVSGPVKIKINGEKELEVNAGSSLMTTLAEHHIYLPSACGGSGTCALCKCQVVSGGGNILPVETLHFTRKQQLEHWRLSCQVKVRENIEIIIPKEIFGIKKLECEVISNHNVSTFIKELILKLPEEEIFTFEPGNYIQVDVPVCEINFSDMIIEDKFKNEWNKLNIWKLKMKNTEPTTRAYSMANYPAEGNIIKLNIRIATPPWDVKKQSFKKVNPGICSSYLFSRKPGDKITISGPYGEFHIQHTQREMVYIGGGAGMAPLRSHILHLFLTEKTNRKVSFWYGARSLQDIFYEEEFRKLEKQFANFSFNIALSEPEKEDNWTGYTGFIHQIVFDNYLCKHPEPEEIEYYLCGPPAMNDAVLKMLDSLGVPHENILFDNFG